MHRALGLAADRLERAGMSKDLQLHGRRGGEGSAKSPAIPAARCANGLREHRGILPNQRETLASETA